MTLDTEDIEAIASAVVRRLGLQSGDIDTKRVAELPLAERRAFWKSERDKEKRGAAKAA